MSETKRKLLMVLVVVMLIGVGVIQSIVDPVQVKLQRASLPESGEANELLVQLPGQFIVASMTGFKEVIAGALWIRADTFFHTGQYQAIIPIVRLVTWLDPHNIDVYTTGAWHLDYNFVDDAQMSDKRYIPASIALLREGIKNNPNMWDLWFELGWTHYNKKLQDYDKALECIEKACQYDGFDPNTGRRTPRPEYVDRMLAHQYEKVGRFQDAIKQWAVARKRVEMMIKDKSSTTYSDQSSLDVCDRNLGMLYLRLAYRYGDMDAYRKGLEIYKRLASRKNAPEDVVRSYKNASADYARRIATNNPPRDALKPLDAGFDVTWKKVAPKVFLIKGKINLCPASEYKDLAVEAITGWYKDNEKQPPEARKLWRDGARVRWMLTDYDYKMPELQTFSLKIDTTKTVVWDSVYVGGGTFSDRIDLSRNSEFYPFTAEKYKLTIWITPQQPDTPDFVQDRIGWKGEALTDKRYLDTKTQPGFKLLRYERILDRKDIM
jgi:tetratricopeptide (TPR) repeat protein